MVKSKSNWLEIAPVSAKMKTKCSRRIRISECIGVLYASDSRIAAAFAYRAPEVRWVGDRHLLFGGGATIQVPAGSLVIDGQQPAWIIPTTINVPQGSLTFVGTTPAVISLLVPVDPSRVFVVLADGRVFEVNAEDRTCVIPQDARVFFVMSDERVA